MSMQAYCLGFLFDGDHVVLIEKKHGPKWMIGLLNGIGGKVGDHVSNETPQEAMVREFEEEAGVKTRLEDWRLFATLRGSYGLVSCYVAYKKVNIRSMTDEKVNFYCNAIGSDPTVVPNLKWLIPMAMDKDKVVATIEDPA